MIGFARCRRCSDPTAEHGFRVTPFAAQSPCLRAAPPYPPAPYPPSHGAISTAADILPRRHSRQRHNRLRHRSRRRIRHLAAAVATAQAELAVAAAVSAFAEAHPRNRRQPNAAGSRCDLPRPRGLMIRCARSGLPPAAELARFQFADDSARQRVSRRVAPVASLVLSDRFAARCGRPTGPPATVQTCSDEGRRGVEARVACCASSG